MSSSLWRSIADKMAMSQPNDRIWILLVQKSPKGPFTFPEVNALLEKGIIRRNDLALKMELKEPGPDGKKVGGNWKILWQYAEFDRRQEEPKKIEVAANEMSSLYPAREGERRRAADDSVRAEQISELLPEELSDIHPEDLIGKTSREMHHNENATAAEISFNSDSVRPTEDERQVPKWVVALIAIAIGGGFYSWLNHRANSSDRRALPRATADSDGSAEGNRAASPKRGMSAAVRKNFNPAGRRPTANLPKHETRADEPPTARDPEPNRYEESPLDRAAPQIDGDKGEVANDSPDENKEAAAAPSADESGEPENEAPKGNRRPARKAKEAVSEEEAPSEANDSAAVQEPAAASDNADSDSN